MLCRTLYLLSYIIASFLRCASLASVSSGGSTNNVKNCAIIKKKCNMKFFRSLLVTGLCAYGSLCMLCCSCCVGRVCERDGATGSCTIFSGKIVTLQYQTKGFTRGVNVLGKCHPL